jgi:putative ABC transport system substrate-binding protein
LIAFLGSLSLSAPHIARAQSRVRRIGVLMMYAESSTEGQNFVRALRQALEKLGWVEGRSLQVDYRWATASRDFIQQSAKELAASQPELIFSSSTPTTAALLQETRTIPIIFGNIADPVGSGFVNSLSQPGGNATGFVNFESATGGKFLELLKEVGPGLKSATMVFNPATAPYAEIYLTPFRLAAAALGVDPIIAPARDLTELEAVMAVQAHEPNSGLTAVPDGFWVGRPAQIASLASRYRLPTVLYSRVFAEAGCLLTYGNDIPDNYRRAATYVDRILKGAKPSDLPVQFPLKFELVVNMKAAKAIGLTVSPTLLVRADDVIE